MGIIEEEDAPLVKSLSRDNVLAFNTLFKRYSSRLYRFSHGYLKSDAESEEIVQEVFAKVWETRSQLKHELSFKSYLFTIAFNVIKKHFRAKAYLSEYFRNEMVDDLDIRTTQDINYNSLKSYLSKIVDTLPERRREIFIKSRFEGLSIDEIARELDISHKTVENQITTALKYIRSCLKREDLQVVLFAALFLL
jgi:RNA polymerase sigma-70 factor (ECF subfamily)